MPIFLAPPLHHVAYTHEAADGTLRAWDVTRGQQMAVDTHQPMLFGLAEHGITPEKVRQLYEGLDETYALTTDLARPLLMIPFSDEYLLIDGWHRLFKAAMLGVPDVLIYVLTQEEADAIQWLELPPGHGLDWR